MPEGKVQFGQKADEGSLSESIITESHSDFVSLVMGSYTPRFTKLSEPTRISEFEEEHISTKSDK